MKAAVIKAPGVLEVQDIPEPVCEPDEIKVKIAYAGICGSDPKILEGTVGALSRPALSAAPWQLPDASRRQNSRPRSLGHGC